MKTECLKSINIYLLKKDFHLFPLFRLSWVPGEEVAPVEKTEEEE